MTTLSFVWPVENHWNHFQVSSVLERPEINPYWTRLSSAIRNISWKDIVDRHNAEYAEKSMSISRALADELSEVLIEIGAESKVPIFANQNNANKPFLIEHKLGPIAIDFSFGHYHAMVWKLARLATSIVSNENEMKEQCKVGILILPQEELRKIGNFDSPSNWERAVDYLQYMGGQWRAPLLLIGLKNPKEFEVLDNGKGHKPRSSVRFF